MTALESVLFAASVFCAAAPLAAQTQTASPGKLVAAPRIDSSLEARENQYFADLSQRLREVYQASGDGRAIALLSHTITEFRARKKGLLAEAALLGPIRSAPRQPPAIWVQTREALLASPAAAKMPARRQRNPALEYAFRRFDEAQLTTLNPPKTPVE
ncbi:hypothetical protein [Hymenobacter elongatus]|uniref:Uncharacterized protein n=1 Tax=Hymenobacter elongatus TaxID=877208 RepID=A0A4Z0PPE4_9BACT|nr:hypothetical protein [Hymenobacter elongatus]TGE19354.1 hypothetical protein E5J99_03680 [Hymenobacter elongatus]